MENDTVEQRERALASLSRDHFDVVVIGGGVVGTGVARDAATRGLRVALIEKEDFGYGTSSRPTRLIHGGLRYLQMFDFALVRDDLKEREILLRIAPHLVRPLPFLVPYYGRSRLYSAKLKAGMLLYDGLSFDKSLPNHRILSPAQVLAEEPSLSPRELSGGALYYDAQVELTERLCVENAVAAVEAGAIVLTHARVVDLLRDGTTVSGVRVQDSFSPRTCDVQGTTTINVSGPWLDELANPVTKGKPLLRRTKGVHLISAPTTRNALVLFAGQDERLFFVVPWLGLSMIGTTDTDYEGDLDTVRATSDDVTYLLDAVRRYVPGGDWHTLHYTQAGVRSLMRVDGVAESAVSRRHMIVNHGQHDSAPGLFSLVGGKLTAYRGVAEDLVDAACAHLGKRLKCTTAEVPLPGGQAGNAAAIIAHRAEPGAPAAGLAPATVAHLAAVYGSRYGRLIGLCVDDHALARPLCPYAPDIMVQVFYAVRHEMAFTLCDVMLRRVGIGLRPCRGLDCAATVAAEMALLLGWDSAHTKDEIAAYESQIHLGDLPSGLPAPLVMAAAN